MYKTHLRWLLLVLFATFFFFISGRSVSGRGGDVAVCMEYFLIIPYDSSPLNEFVEHCGIDYEDKEGNTMLHVAIAVSKKKNKIASKLLEYGSSLTNRNNHGQTPLHLAAKVGDLDLIKELVKHGAASTLAFQDNSGLTPLSLANINSRPEVIKYLLRLQRVSPKRKKGGGVGVHSRPYRESDDRRESLDRGGLLERRGSLERGGIGAGGGEYNSDDENPSESDFTTTERIESDERRGPLERIQGDEQHETPTTITTPITTSTKTAGEEVVLDDYELFLMEEEEEESENDEESQMKKYDNLVLKLITDWTEEEVQFWLTTLGLSPSQEQQCQQQFRHHHVSGKILVFLTDDVLKEDFAITSFGIRHLILSVTENLKWESKTFLEKTLLCLDTYKAVVEIVVGTTGCMLTCISVFICKNWKMKDD